MSEPGEHKGPGFFVSPAAVGVRLAANVSQVIRLVAEAVDQAVAAVLDGTCGWYVGHIASFQG